MYIVTHQYRAEGSTFKKFKESFVKNLHECAEPHPLLINSHTGKDYFSLKQNLELIDAAKEFSAKSGILVAHETHRGRMGYSPQMMSALLEKKSDFFITADFSHWVCVTESMLDNFMDVLNQTIIRSRHVHARVGFEQGPQVADPRAPEYKYAFEKFLSWWDEIVCANLEAARKTLSITTEFGPIPYMPTIPFANSPLADQFEVNCFMKDFLRDRYCGS